jgi:hypothetical protein
MLRRKSALTNFSALCIVGLRNVASQHAKRFLIGDEKHGHEDEQPLP